MNDANAKWIEETWPTIEDKALGDLVRERDEARAEVTAMRLAAKAALDLAERRRHGVWIPSSAVASLLAAMQK